MVDWFHLMFAATVFFSLIFVGYDAVCHLQSGGVCWTSAACRLSAQDLLQGPYGTPNDQQTYLIVRFHLDNFFVLTYTSVFLLGALLSRELQPNDHRYGIDHHDPVVPEPLPPDGWIRGLARLLIVLAVVAAGSDLAENFVALDYLESPTATRVPEVIGGFGCSKWWSVAAAFLVVAILYVKRVRELWRNRWGGKPATVGIPAVGGKGAGTIPSSAADIDGEAGRDSNSAGA